MKSLKYLAKGEYSLSATIACIRALALIGSDLALDMLEGYANDLRQLVINELLRAWDYFDRETYASRIYVNATR